MKKKYTKKRKTKRYTKKRYTKKRNTKKQSSKKRYTKKRIFGGADGENQAKEYGGSLEELKDDVDLWKDYCHSVINLKEFIHLL